MPTHFTLGGLIAAVLTGCASAPTNYPLRAQIDGQRGFTMQGTMRSAGAAEKTRSRIQKSFDAACRGPSKITQLNIEPRGSSIGLKFYDYDATALCVPPSTD